MRNLYKRTLLLTIVCLLLVSFKGNANLGVTATGTNGNCLSNAVITATATGNTGTVYYELLQGASIIRNYQASNVFANLPVGSYTVQVQDGITLATAQSGTVLLTTTYVGMHVTVTNSAVGCATATTGTITATTTGGKTPYSYSITSGPVLKSAQVSNIFNGLPVGSYTVSVTDACGVTVTNSGSVTVGTSTTTADIAPRYGTVNNTCVTYPNNNCAATGQVTIGGNWGYRNNGLNNLSTFDQNHFYWRYIYPSGSGSLYGAGGVQNGPLIKCTVNSTNMPATASYPFGKGDLVIYNECGDSTIIVKNITANAAPTGNDYAIGNYDCVNGGTIVTQIWSFTLTCLPVYWVFKDQTTGTTILDTSFAGQGYKTFTGFTPGHTYNVSAKDASGHNATATSSTPIPASPNPIVFNGYYPDYNLLHAGFPRVGFPYSLNPPYLNYSYKVIASSTGNPAVGYVNSHNLNGSTNFGSATGGFIWGPNSDGSWPDGTYTINYTVGCITSPITFTIGNAGNPTLNASLNSDIITPVCGGFNLSENATLDNPSLYAIKIMPGSASNVGAIQTFSNSSTPGTYISQPFNGLSYGTYNLALMTTSFSVGTGAVSLITRVVNYSASNTLTINALSTGGYICAGYATGSLVINASSASGSPLQYSIDNGLTYQGSNVFTGLAPGNYTTMVKDACGNTARYVATIVQSSNISATASANTVCAGSLLQLNVNAIGATSYAWTGPNGFTSTQQNPSINNIQASGAGTYTVTVSSPSCSNTASVAVAINPLPTATIHYPGAPFCPQGTIAPVITGTPGGNFTATPGLSINPVTGVVDLALSGTGSFIITYHFSDLVTGCSNTTTATLLINPAPIVLTHNLSICAPATADITASAVTTGSTAGLVYSYFTDAAGTLPLASPNAISASGTYYIQGKNPLTGCTAIAPVTVTIKAQPLLNITNPAGVCAPATVDITAPAVTAGSSASLSFNYFTDAAATNPLPQVNSIGTSGTYYILANSTLTGCSTIQPITVTINPKPILVITNPAPVCAPLTIDLTASAITSGSSIGLTYTYYTDAAATTLVPNATAVNVSGTYYLKGTTASGCSDIQPVVVTINPAPVLVITNPASVCSPGTVDITNSSIVAGSTAGLVFTYFSDAAGTIGLINPTTISVSGTYYIKGTTASGCSTMQPVNVTVNASPVLNITNPGAVCAPGIVNLTDPALTAGSSSGLNDTYYLDAAASAVLANPAAISSSGIYYIKGTAASGCSTVQPVNVVINVMPTASINYAGNPYCATGTALVTITGQTGGIFSAAPVGLSIDAITGTANLAASVPGTYTITYLFSSGACTNSATASITIVSPALSITDPAAVCSPGVVDLTQPAITAGSAAGLSYSYYTDAAASIVLPNPATVSSSNTYYIKGLNAQGCPSLVKPVQITILAGPAIAATADSSQVCKGGLVTLTAVSPGNSIVWQGLAAGNPVQWAPVTTATYTAIATDAMGCTQSAQVTVTVRDFNASLAANPNPMLAGTTVTLSTSASSPYQVLSWLPASYFTNATALTQTITVSDSSRTFYAIARSKDGCVDTAQIYIQVTDNSRDFFVPNAFSPNGDGNNDVFKVYSSSLKELHLMVFNQWGQLLYETKDVHIGWDGIYNGNTQPTGIYLFAVRAVLNNGAVITKKGTFNLIR